MNIIDRFSSAISKAKKGETNTPIKNVIIDVSYTIIAASVLDEA